MAFDPLALSAIAGMALATFILRMGGVWMAGRKASSPFLRTSMRHAPGAILVAMLAPVVLAGGLPTIAAAGATVLVSRRTGNLPVAIVAGVVAFAALDSVLP
jgi:uncharacterized membrane protein